MTRSAKTSRCGIVVVITLVLRTIAKKNAPSRARRKFVALNRRKKYKTDNQNCVGDRKIWHKSEDVHMEYSRENGGGSAIDEVNGSHNGFSPKILGN